MKIANAILGGSITTILLMGVLFKIMHWPGAGLMIIVSSTFLALFVYLVAIANIINYKKNILLKICNGLGAFFGSIVIIGFLFKIMHWPGSGIMIIIGTTLSSFVLLLIMISFIIYKEPIKLSSGTFFSVIAFGILAFGVAVQGPSYSILTSMVANNQKTENIISKSAWESVFHVAESAHAKPYEAAVYELHRYIDNLKVQLYVVTDGLPLEIADTISLDQIMGKDNYDAPTHLLGITDPENPIKISGLKEFSAITLKEKIQEFNKKMKALDSSYEPIQTNKQYRYDGGIDSWETATFYHMPLAQVILTLNLIDAEALAKCNRLIVINYPTIEIKQNESKEEQ